MKLIRTLNFLVQGTIRRSSMAWSSPIPEGRTGRHGHLTRQTSLFGWLASIAAELQISSCGVTGPTKTAVCSATKRARPCNICSSIASSHGRPGTFMDAIDGMGPEVGGELIKESDYRDLSGYAASENELYHANGMVDLKWRNAPISCRETLAVLSLLDTIRVDTKSWVKVGAKKLQLPPPQFCLVLCLPACCSLFSRLVTFLFYQCNAYYVFCKKNTFDTCIVALCPCASGFRSSFQWMTTNTRLHSWKEDKLFNNWQLKKAVLR